MTPNTSNSTWGTSGGSTSRRTPSTAAKTATAARIPACACAASTSTRRNPHVRRGDAGRSTRVAATSAIPRPAASVNRWAVSVSSARLPVITAPTNCATSSDAEIPKAIAILRRCSGVAASPKW